MSWEKFEIIVRFFLKSEENSNQIQNIFLKFEIFTLDLYYNL